MFVALTFKQLIFQMPNCCHPSPTLSCFHSLTNWFSSSWFQNWFLGGFLTSVESFSFLLRVGTNMLPKFLNSFWISIIEIISGRDLLKSKSCHHIETSPLIWSANQLNGFHKMVTSGFHGLH